MTAEGTPSRCSAPLPQRATWRKYQFEKLRERPLLRSPLSATVKNEKIGDDVSELQDLPRPIKELENDKDWRGAVWDVYIQDYWSFVAEFCNKTEDSVNRPGPIIKTPLVKGFIVDTAINHGADLGAFNVVFDKMKNKHSENEKEWFKDFARTRHEILKSGFEHLDTSSTGDRCKMWLRLGEQDNWELKRPIQPYKGYWVR